MKYTKIQIQNKPLANTQYTMIHQGSLTEIHLCHLHEGVPKTHKNTKCTKMQIQNTPLANTKYKMRHFHHRHPHYRNHHHHHDNRVILIQKI